jgi:hypothetical protein
MQKHKFSVTCLDALFVESVPVAPEHENSALTFYGLDTPECTTSPTDPAGYKKKFGLTCPVVLFVKSIPGPPEHEI